MVENNVSGLSELFTGVYPILVFGDCLEVMGGLEDASVDLVLADLPYGTTNCAWDSQIDLASLWVAYSRVCRGAVVLFAQTPFDKVLGVSNLSWLRYEWIWEKTAATGHLNANRAPMKAHENVLVFCAGPAPYFPIKTSGHIRKSVARSCHGSDVYGSQTVTAYDSTDRFPRSVISFPKDKQVSSLHSTQKPVALLEYLIRSHSEPGAVVLDNCMGSGSTGEACHRTGRRFIGIEKDAAIFEVARARLSNLSLL